MSNLIVQTKLFEARPFSPKDADLTASWMSASPKELFMLSSSLTYPVKPSTLIKNAQRARSEEHKFYSVFLIGTGLQAGYFEIKNINLTHRLGTIAHVILAPEYRGKGMGKDFVDLASKVAFTGLKLYRVNLSVHTVNRCAINAYIKGGYSFEGLLREVLSYKGKRYSLYQMSLLRPEWEEANG